MHLGNGAITPECGVVALGVAAVGVGAAWLATRTLAVDRLRPRASAALGAAIFAAQLFNVQILPFSSAHLVGGVLLAWLLSPALAVLAMAAILATQAVLLGDGGLLALGANLINMGIVPAIGVWLLRRGLARAQGADQQPSEAAKGAAVPPLTTALSPKTAVALGGVAFVCTIAGAAAIVGEVAIGRSEAAISGWGQFAIAMLSIHALAGLLEATLTVAIAALLARIAEPGAASHEAIGSGTTWRLNPRMAGGLVAASLVVALLSLPAIGLASASPDGYEAALAQATTAGGAIGGIESDHALTGWAATVEGWQQNMQDYESRLLAHTPAPEAVLFGLATLVAAVFVGALARVAGKRPPIQQPCQSI